LILASISREGDSPFVVALFFMWFAPHSGQQSLAELRRQTSVDLRQYLVRGRKELLAKVPF
jgi:hypothetical protein